MLIGPSIETVWSTQSAMAIAVAHMTNETGIHGISHWARVLDNGLKVAKHSGANEKIVCLFAVFHDSQRISDGYDPLHGKRGGELARTFRGKYFELSDEDFHSLLESSSCSCGNRLRYTEFESWFSEAGFDLTFNPNMFADKDYLEDLRMRAIPRYHEMPLEALRVLSGRFFLTKR